MCRPSTWNSGRSCRRSTPRASSAEDAVERIDLTHHAEHLPAARVRVDLRGVQRMYMVLEGTAD